MRLLACVGIKQQFVTPCVSVGRHVVVCRLCTLTHYHTVGSWLRHRPENNNKAFTILNTNQNRIVNDVQFSEINSIHLNHAPYRNMLCLYSSERPGHSAHACFRCGRKKKNPNSQLYRSSSADLLGNKCFFFTNQEIGLKYNHISLSAEKRRFLID